MTTMDLLSTCHAAGILLSVDGDKLLYEAPSGTLTPMLLDQLRAHKPHLLPVVSRLDAMRRHGIGRPGRPPVPMACWPHLGGPGTCGSCGDRLTHPRACGRCDPCEVAAELFYRSAAGGRQ